MYIKHSLFYFLAKLAPALTSFIVLAAYTHWMTTEEYGIFNTILVIASSVSLFSFGWLYVGIMRFWEQKTLNSQTLANLITICVLAITIIVGLISALIGFFTDKYDIALGFFFIFLSSACYESWQRINSITQQVERYLLIEIGRTVVTALVGIFLVWYGYTWKGAVGGIVVGIGLALVVSGAIQQFWHSDWRKIDFSLLKSLLTYGLPLSISLVLLEIIHVSDRVLLGWLKGYASAGEYAVAYNLPYQIIMMLTSSLNLAAYPIVIKSLEKEGQVAAENKLQEYLILLLGISLPAIVGLMVISPLLIPLLVGKEFVIVSIKLLPWISIAVLANCFYLFYVSLSFQLAKQTRGSLKIVALAALLNIVLNIIFIPTYGAVGSTGASIVAYILCLVYGYYLGNKHFALLLPWQDLLKISLATVIMAGFLFLLPVLSMPVIYQLVLNIALGACIYASLIWLFDVGNIRVLLKPYYARLGHLWVAY